MIYGERIRQARELRGLTQHELARQIGVTQPTIAHLESGLYEGEDRVAEIAFKTGFPPSFFSDPFVEDFPAGSLQFRGRSSISRKDRQQAYRYAQTLYELFKRASQRTSRPPHRVPRVVGTTPAEAAQLTRSAMGVAPDTPIKHLVNAVEHLGVVVLALPIHLEGREAFSMWADDTPVIAFSTGRPGDRVRLSVAHELGHLVMHHAMRGAVRAMERDAYAYAGELLLPQVAMSQDLVTPVTLTALAQLKLKWRVSMQALAVRAKELRIITERQYYHLFEQIGRLGYRVAEPENLAVPIEKPRLLRQLLEMRYGVPIDLGRLAADSNLTQALLRDVVDSHAGRPANSVDGAVRKPMVIAFSRSARDVGST